MYLQGAVDLTGTLQCPIARTKSYDAGISQGDDYHGTHCFLLIYSRGTGLTALHSIEIEMASYGFLFPVISTLARLVSIFLLPFGETLADSRFVWERRFRGVGEGGVLLCDLLSRT